jgi:putative oxidoreductase
MRRLFTSFARGAPGAGLLLLRATTGSALIYYGVSGLLAHPALPSVAWQGLLALLGGLLFAGLWTPAAGLLAMVATLWEIVASPVAWPQFAPIAIMAAALALLGPGAWSIDARLYGWQQIRIPSRRQPGGTSD